MIYLEQKELFIPRYTNETPNTIDFVYNLTEETVKTVGQTHFEALRNYIIVKPIELAEQGEYTIKVFDEVGGLLQSHLATTEIEKDSEIVYNATDETIIYEG